MRLTLLQRFVAWLARVVAVDVGKVSDGLVSIDRAGTDLDKRWGELYQEFTNAREAWRKNPLARRLIGLITSYVVGDGIKLGSDYAALRRYLVAFVGHEQNLLALRQEGWCDELARAGELFILLFYNPVDGMSYVRALPASSIDKIETRPGDYETELRYHEVVGIDDADYDKGGRWWLGVAAAGINEPDDTGHVKPIMLHFAVNRPVGCVRGESDLAPILPWLKRYSRWLEDRVRLNAAVRAFLWIVKVPGNMVTKKAADYKRPPEPGTVMVVDKDNEDWTAIAPELRARDASQDGRAIRWMIVAGGPGVGLPDVGEAENANLATAKAMGEQRTKFMRQRQAYFSYVLAQVALTGYNRAVTMGRWRGRIAGLSDVSIAAPDISVADNTGLAAAAQSVAAALRDLQTLGLAGSAFRRLALRLVTKFAGEGVGDVEAREILAESEGEDGKKD